MNIYIQLHTNHKCLLAFSKIFSLLLLFTINFPLLTYSQEPPFPTEHLQLWLRADSVQLTNGKVSRWYDLSPNNYVIQQTTASAMPTIYKSAVLFNGTSSYLNGGNILNMDTKEWTWIIVGKGTDPCIVKYNRNSSFFNSGSMWNMGLNSFSLRTNGTTMGFSTHVNTDINNIITYELFNRTNLKCYSYVNNGITNSLQIPNVNATNTLDLYIGGNLRTSTATPPTSAT